MNFEEFDSENRTIFIEEEFKGKILNIIDGTLGLVYILKSTQGNHCFAIKTINPAKLTKLPRAEAITQFKRELNQWYTYRHHRFILTPFFVKIINNWPFIAMPARERSLRDYIDKTFENLELSQVESLSIAVQICHGLAFAKTKGLIAHQDLKPDNILLQNLRKHFILPPDFPLNWRVSIADFGMANAYKEIGKPTGSRPYMAPEQYSPTNNFSKVDVFALGVIFTELFSGYHPLGLLTPNVWPEPKPEFSNAWRQEKKWRTWARKDLQKIESTISLIPQEIRNLLERMLLVDANQRPTVEEVEIEIRSILKKHSQQASEFIENLLIQWDKSALESESFDRASPEQYEEQQMREFDKLKENP